MKKMISLVLSVVLAVTMAVGLTGCGDEAGKLVGTWQTEVDMVDFLNEGMASEDAELAEYLQAATFPLILQFTFQDDNTYAMTVDEEALAETFDGYMATFKDGLNQYFEDMIADMGMEMSVDDLFAEMGMSVDDMIAEFMSEDVISEMAEEFYSEGNYDAKDGKLFLSDGLDYAIDEAVYEVYELDGSKLTLVETVGSEDEEFSDMFYPLTFEKVK